MAPFTLLEKAIDYAIKEINYIYVRGSNKKYKPLICLSKTLINIIQNHQVYKEKKIIYAMKKNDIDYIKNNSIKLTDDIIWHCLQPEYHKFLDLMLNYPAEKSHEERILSRLIYNQKVGVNIIRKFLDKNPEVDINNGRNEPALCLAVDAQEFEKVEFFLKEKKTDIHILNDLALKNAVETGNRQIIRYLLNNGADKSDVQPYHIRLGSMNSYLSEELIELELV
jgi:hypothetical protein